VRGKKVLSRFALLSGFRIKCGMTEFKFFDLLIDETNPDRKEIFYP